MNGLQIRNLRQNKGLSLRAFGKQVGLSGERIRVLEAYDYISPDIQERICAAFSVDSADPLFYSLSATSQGNQGRTSHKKTKTAQSARKAAEREALKPVRAELVRKMRMNAGLSQKELAACRKSP